MTSINVNTEDSSREDPEQENENARLREMDIVEYYNNSNSVKRQKNSTLCYKIMIGVFIVALVFTFFLLSKKTVDIIYEDRTSLNNINKKDENVLAVNVNNITNEKVSFEQNIQNNNQAYNKTKKIGLAFVYSTLFSNGIARFITVTANHFMKTGKYDICFITEKPYHKEYTYNSSIKRFIAHNNYTLIRNNSKTENIDIFIVQNVISPEVVNFYRSIGKKVIGMFHGVFMSSMFHGSVTGYKNWINFDLFDSYIFIAPDDYYFYKKLGFKNEIYIPNLYTFEPSETKDSNLTYNNIMMLGRQNDPIKGAIYAIQAMSLVVKEIPDARLTLVTSDGRIQFLKNLTIELNLTNNVFINFHTYDISSYFWNSSVYWFTSLSEAFPMAMNEGKAHGLPIVAFDVPYSPPYQNGVIVVDQLDIEGLARETINLLKDYDYRKRMGQFAKKSLDNYSNNETVELWGRLFEALLSNDINNYRNLQNEIEKKYYNEENAKIHMKKHYRALLRYNKNFTCHTLEDFTNLQYIQNIKDCYTR